MNAARLPSGPTGGVCVAEICFASYPLLLAVLPVIQTWPAPGAVVVAVAAPLLVVTVLFARWRRGWALVVLPGGATALVVRGLLRTRVVPWADVVSVSWTPYVGGRTPTWAKTWVLARIEDRWWAVPVALSGRDPRASRTAAAIWQLAPEHLRGGIALFGGPPVRPRPVAPAGPEGIRVRAWRDEPRWGAVEGDVVFGPDAVRFTTLGRSTAQVWPGARAVRVDLGSSPTASEQVGLLLERPDLGPVWLRLDRADAPTALALVAGSDGAEGEDGEGDPFRTG